MLGKGGEDKFANCCHAPIHGHAAASYCRPRPPRRRRLHSAQNQLLSRSRSSDAAFLSRGVVGPASPSHGQWRRRSRRVQIARFFFFRLPILLVPPWKLEAGAHPFLESLRLRLHSAACYDSVVVSVPRRSEVRDDAITNLAELFFFFLFFFSVCFGDSRRGGERGFPEGRRRSGRHSRGFRVARPDCGRWGRRWRGFTITSLSCSAAVASMRICPRRVTPANAYELRVVFA